MIVDLRSLVNSGHTSEEARKMDEAKNMALLFFMDHLMQKNGRRTIHDLSCQFGARGFTDEMRNAVGTTQEGLTDFLSSYPSLFSVDGDQVILKGFGEIDGKNQLMKMPGASRQRDYEHEAVEFFEQKLQKFGPELQIKSLLGHRSQAAPEVRLVSGRHLKEFCDFLQSQHEHFIVEGDRVRLKNMPEPNDEAVELDDEGKPLVGVKAKQAAVDFLKGILEANEDTPIPLETFYRRFCERFPHAVRQEVATNPKELLQFLKLNRSIFFIRSNKVSLVKLKPEGADGDGSESGRSTASVDSSSTNENNNVLFPLCPGNLHRIHFVKALKQATDTVQNLRNDLSMQPERFLGLDFKVVQLGGSNPEEFISLIIVASTSRIAIFDLAHSDVILMESGLKELLEDAQTLKVVHEVRRISTLMSQRYSVYLRGIFDTQVAHTIIQHEKLGKPLNELRGISFINLQRVYYPQSLMNSDITPRKLSQSPSWGARPLNEDMLLQAAEECHCLVTALYRLLTAQLPDSCRRLFEEKCLEACQTQKPAERLHQSSSNHQLNASNSFDFTANLYRPPARRQSSTTSASSQPEQQQQRPSNGRLVKQHSGQGQQWMQQKPKMCEAATQTFSTGEIQVLQVYYDT
ncbi:Exonuclease 3'-5' domain-containing protein 1 [Aphelenchoides bicaudatus]|nr:Exonuclease 3'-5' domain-containing protein 1 [Aphelenchoides bicaudatus]